MSDLISKSETIDLLYQVFEKYSMATDKNDPLSGFGAELFKNIKAMPTAYSVDKGDMKHNLAEMYAKNMVDYGVDVTEAWQTATQQSCALEKAYIRGRQYEVDRFNKLRKEYNGGWIPCSERLPEIDGNTSDIVLACGSNGFQYMAFWCDDLKWRFCECGMAKNPILWTEIVAWQPLPEPYKESED